MAAAEKRENSITFNLRGLRSEPIETVDPRISYGSLLLLLIEGMFLLGPSNAAPEWQGGSVRWRGAEISWWPVHSRGLFEVSRLCRQHLQTFASTAEALSFKE